MNWIENICDYINKVAYSYIAVSGESFCTSAWHGQSPGVVVEPYEHGVYAVLSVRILGTVFSSVSGFLYLTCVSISVHFSDQ